MRVPERVLYYFRHTAASDIARLRVASAPRVAIRPIVICTSRARQLHSPSPSRDLVALFSLFRSCE